MNIRPLAPLCAALVLLMTAASASAVARIRLPLAGSALSLGQQLQAVVNDPANAGVQVVLAPGHYLLTASAPNAGRLVLQPGMSIAGSNEYVDCDRDGIWDPVAQCAESGADPDRFTRAGTETLIDGSLLASVPGAPAVAVIRTGLDNTVENVTVKALRDTGTAGSIDVNLVSARGTLSAILRNNVLTGGQRGIRCQNGLAPQQAVSATDGDVLVEGNVIRDIAEVPTKTQFGIGVQVQNGFTEGNRWHARIWNNRITQTRIGVFVVGNSSSNTSTSIDSAGNLIERNSVGVWIASGFDAGQAVSGQFNSISFDSKSDRFLNNAGSYVTGAGFGGGILAFAGLRDGKVSAGSNGNTLQMKLLHATFAGNRQGNVPRNMTVIASRSNFDDHTGTGNSVDLMMRDTTRLDAAAFATADSSPTTGGGANTVDVSADVTFTPTNPPLLP